MRHPTASLVPARGRETRSSADLRGRGHATLVALVAMALGSAGCGPAVRSCITMRPEVAAAPETVQVVFLGVGGVLIRWQGAAVMTAPLYSNPTIAEIALSEIHTDRQRVDALLPRTDDVRAILSGHAHYDHLMDVPYVAIEKATAADVLANDAAKKLLAPIRKDLRGRHPPNDVLSLEDQPTCGWHPVPGTQFRVRAIRSEHSPQMGTRLVHGLLKLPDVVLWRGEDEYPRLELPTRAGMWPAGTPLALLIDLLDPKTGEVVFRIYYQDSPTRRPYGYPPDCGSERPVDLAILCMGGATEFPSFPEDIVGALQPRFVMGTHWEDFFVPRRLPLPGESNAKEAFRFAPGVDEREFLRRVLKAQGGGGQVSVPCPDATTVFRRNGNGWRLERAEGWTRPTV